MRPSRYHTGWTTLNVSFIMHKRFQPITPGWTTKYSPLPVFLHDITSPFDRKPEHVGLSMVTAREVLGNIGYPPKGRRRCWRSLWNIPLNNPGTVSCHQPNPEYCSMLIKLMEPGLLVLPGHLHSSDNRDMHPPLQLHGIARKSGLPSAICRQAPGGPCSWNAWRMSRIF